MKKVYLLFAFMLSLMGVTQLKAATLEEGFESVTLTDADGNALANTYSYGYGLSNGWKVIGGSIYGSAGSTNYGLWSTAHTGSKSLEASYGSSNAASVVITEKLTGKFTFWARKTSSSSSTKGTITLYEATEDGGTYTVTSTKLYTNSSLTTTWTQYTVDLGVDGKYVAINMVRAGIDDISAEIFEEGVEKKVLGVNAFEAAATTVNATAAKKYTANFNVTVENKGNVDLTASEVKVTLLAADKTTELTSATAAADLAQGATTKIALEYEGDADADQTVTFYVREDVTGNIYADAATITVQAYGARFAIDADGSAEDYGFIAKSGSSSKTYTVTNSGNAALTVNIAAPTGFTAAPTTLNVAGGETGTFTVSLNTDAIGTKSGNVALTADALDVTSFTIPVSAYVYDPEAYFVDFNDNQLPQGWETTGWTFSDGVANGAYTYGTKHQLITPTLIVKEGDVLAFQAKATGSYSSLPIYVAKDGGDFTLNKTISSSDLSQTTFKTYTVEGLAAGSYKIRFDADDTQIDNFAGFALDENAPVLAVTRDDAVVADGATDDFGKVKAATTHTYTVSNTGTGTLSVAIASSKTSDFTVTPATLEVAAGESKTFDVAVVFNETYGAKAADITITPTGKTAFTIHATATTADPNVWEEDFESGIPATWMNTGWTIVDAPSYGNGTKMAYATMTAGYELITPRLEAKAGDKLEFDALLPWNDETLKVEYSTDERATWTEAFSETPAENNTLTTLSFTAPADGFYYLKFTGRYNYVDNFAGFKLALPDHDAIISSVNIPATANQYVAYTATVTVKELVGKDEDAIAALYINNVEVATQDVTLAANSETPITLTYTPQEAGNVEAYVLIVWNGDDLKTDAVTVSIAEVPTLSDLDDEDIEAGDYTVLALDYDVQAGWNTIVLPFRVTDLSVFGENVKAYGFTNYTDGELKFDETTTLNTATPYVLYVETPTTETITFSNVTIYSADTDDTDAKTVRGEATFQGTYKPLLSGELEGKYGVVPATGKIQKGGASAVIAGFRAYFVLPADVEESKLSLIFTDANGETNSIRAISSQLFGNGNAAMYNLNGQRVNANYKGVVIQNGVKKIQK